jgi:alginate O-acetyltransferase complex protein AlgJ
MAETASPKRSQEIRDAIATGLDGYLFHRFDQAFEQLCGKAVLTAEQVEKWLSLLETRLSRCREGGAAYRFLVAPEKHAVYPDKLPAGSSLASGRPVRQLLASLTPELRAAFVYPEAALKEGRKNEETYYRTDVHWTDYGAYLAYAELVKKLGFIPLPLDTVTRRPMRMVGDLGVRLDPEPVEEGVRLVPPRQEQVRKVFGNQAFGRGQVEVFENEDSGLPRGVLFRDSNATAMLPFLTPHFSRLVAVSSAEFLYDLVRAERPSLVITEMTERYIAYPANSLTGDSLDFPHEARADGFVALTSLTLPLPSGRRDFSIAFRAGGNYGAFMGEGWSEPEESHVWALGPESSLSLPVPAEGGDHELELDVMGCTPPPHSTSQRLRILLDGTELGNFEIGLPVTVSCRLPTSLLSGRSTLELRLLHPDFVSPKEAGFSEDTRFLSIALSALRLRPIEEGTVPDGR